MKLYVRTETGEYKIARKKEIQAYIKSVYRVPPSYPLTSPDRVREFLQAQLSLCEHEVFAAIWLTNQHETLGYSELFRGTIDSATVYPREVVKEALAINAAAVIFAHNHPSGLSQPSEADKQITTRLSNALTYVGVRVLDHFVVGKGDCYSFAENGLM